MKKNIYFIYVLFLFCFTKNSLGVIFFDVKDGDILGNVESNKITIVAFDTEAQHFHSINEFTKPTNNKLICYAYQNSKYSYGDFNLKFDRGFTVDAQGNIRIHNAYNHTSVIRTFGTIMGKKNLTSYIRKKNDFRNEIIIKYPSSIIEKVGEEVEINLKNINKSTLPNIKIQKYKFENNQYLLENGDEKDYIFKAPNKIKGMLGELTLEMIMMSWGLRMLPSKVGKDQGFDGVFQSENNHSNSTKDALFLTESKFEKEKRGVRAVFDQYLSEAQVFRKTKTLSKENQTNKQTGRIINDFITTDINNNGKFSKIWLIAHKIKIPNDQGEPAIVKFFIRRFDKFLYNLVLQRSFTSNTPFKEKKLFLDNLIAQQQLESKNLQVLEVEKILDVFSIYETFFDEIKKIFNSPPLSKQASIEKIKENAKKIEGFIPQCSFKATQKSKNINIFQNTESEKGRAKIISKAYRLNIPLDTEKNIQENFLTAINEIKSANYIISLLDLFEESSNYVKPFKDIKINFKTITKELHGITKENLPDIILETSKLKIPLDTEEDTKKSILKSKEKIEISFKKLSMIELLLSKHAFKLYTASLLLKNPAEKDKKIDEHYVTYTTGQNEIMKKYEKNNEKIEKEIYDAAVRDVFLLMCDKVYRSNPETKEFISVFSHLTSHFSRSNKVKSHVKIWDEMLENFQKKCEEKNKDSICIFKDFKKSLIQPKTIG